MIDAYGGAATRGAASKPLDAGRFSRSNSDARCALTAPGAPVIAFAGQSCVLHAVVWPALALVAGTAIGIVVACHPAVPALVLLVALSGAVYAYLARRPVSLVGCVLAGWAGAGAALGGVAEREAREPPLRRTIAASGRGPVRIVGILRQDASPVPQGVGLSLDVEAIALHGRWQPARAGVMLSVVGTRAPEQAHGWRAGRRVRLSATLREPARYFAPGVPDHALSLARRGTVLVGTVKSGDLIEVLAPGTWVDEAASAGRQHVRRLVAASVGGWSAGTAAVVTAILIGDRAGLEPRVERDLQEAGTYHVIAISGGNIAILAGCLLVTARLMRLRWPVGPVVTVLLLVAYAQLAAGGSSVARATTMAVVYLVAGIADQRSAPASALALSAVLILLVTPLALIDPGFLLTFGATIGILVVVPPLVTRAPRVVPIRAAVALLGASIASEVALLPLGAAFFSRITLAGLLLNFAAVPLMTVVQIGGMTAVTLAALLPDAARPAGFVPHLAADALLGSATLVRWAPWLTWRVPAPPIAVTLAYYAGLIAMLTARWWVRYTVPYHRWPPRVAAPLAAAAACWVLAAPALHWPAGAERLRVTVLDVGQGDATVIQLPGGPTVLVDAGGLAGASRFDVGERVVAPALWALGVRRLDVLALTHGDPDHIGGAAAMLDIFAPREVWEGVAVPGHRELAALSRAAGQGGAIWRTVAAGDAIRQRAAVIRVWHPPRPDWERRRVRNDDSIVLEVRYRDVSIVLPGDIGSAVERQLTGSMEPAAIRILKVPHHGSASSSSLELLQHLQPQIVLISCGRGNRFGHPAPAVLERYATVGAAVYRTDQQGTLTLETDGRTVSVRTFVGSGDRGAAD